MRYTIQLGSPESKSLSSAFIVFVSALATFFLFKRVSSINADISTTWSGGGGSSRPCGVDTGLGRAGDFEKNDANGFDNRGRSRV